MKEPQEEWGDEITPRDGTRIPKGDIGELMRRETRNASELREVHRQLATITQAMQTLTGALQACKQKVDSMPPPSNSKMNWRTLTPERLVLALVTAALLYMFKKLGIEI
jgi:uncharacterized membrane protein